MAGNIPFPDLWSESNTTLTDSIQSSSASTSPHPPIDPDCQQHTLSPPLSLVYPPQLTGARQRQRGAEFGLEHADRFTRGQGRRRVHDREHYVSWQAAMFVFFGCCEREQNILDGGGKWVPPV